MNQLEKLFNYEGYQVRTVMKNEEPWFVVADVCQVLALSNPTESIRALDEDEQSTLRISEGGPERNIINEAGLYTLIIRSNKTEAKQFKRWVTHEVLPSIRKHGGYLTPEKMEEALLNPDTLIRLATELKNERAERVKLQEKTDADRPKVIFAEALETSNTTILIGELAKLLKQNGIDIGQNRLFDHLRNQGYLGKRGDYRNIPT